MFGMSMYGGGMNMYGGMGTQGSGNIPQYYKNKYGCEACFRSGPVIRSLPIEVPPMTKEEARPSFFRRLKQRIMG